MESLKRKEETWTLGVSRGGGRRGPLESWEGARGMDSWSLKGQEAWTLGVSRGSERHRLMDLQARDVDSWSLERGRETWTPEVTREALDVDSWSLERKRGIWTPKVTSESEGRGLLESLEEARVMGGGM